MGDLQKRFAIELCRFYGENPTSSYLVNTGTQSLPKMEKVFTWEDYYVRAGKYLDLLHKAKGGHKHGA